MAAAHQTLQLKQKRIYAVDRAKAAQDFPHTELYMGFDGGSGFEFWLPHLSANDMEGPNKAADNVHCPLFKIMNGIVHGDRRSHVIISPWSVLAGASHVCESIMIAINTVYQEHGDLPKMATVQADNASVNHNMCVLGFLGLYCLLGVFNVSRLRFELENHAHDIYDAFQGIHKTAITRKSYFFFEEMIDIIKASHATSLRFSHGEWESNESTSARPIMGPDVMVTNLWEVRDMWEWMWPGYRKSKEDAFSHGAVVYYEKISPYHDFELRRDTTDVNNPKVELWAKKYMSSLSYEHVGTLTTWKLFKNVMRAMPTSTEETNKRSEKADAALDKLEKLTKGNVKQQF